MSRPCRWPDGGCQAQVEFLETGNRKADGSKVLQVVNATPERRLIQMHDDGTPCTCPLAERGGPYHSTMTVYTWRDHHADCEPWKAKVARERAARASR